MSDFNLPGRFGNEFLTNAVTGTFRSTEDLVFVDVGERVIDAKVVRDGIDVGTYEINPDRLNDIIVGRPEIRTRIIQQSIPAGTPVPVGTAVNLVVAQTGALPTGVIKGVHTDLVERPLGDVFTDFVKDNSAITRILTRVGADYSLSDSDREELSSVFAQNNIPLTDEAGRDVKAAIDTLRAAVTFGS